MKVSKEFIIEAHKAACSKWKTRVENEFPKLFKDRVKSGNWYKGEGRTLIFVKRIEDGEIFGYGFDMFERYYEDDENPWGLGCNPRIATKEEVKQALISEAKNRGFEYGVKFKNNLGYKCVVGSVPFRYENNTLYAIGYGKHAIFEYGKWAEIIPQAKELTVSEIEDKLGYKIKIVK